MTEEQFIKANKLKDKIRDANRNIDLLLKEQAIITLISEQQGMSRVEYRLYDSDVREVLVQYYRKRLETLEKEFEEL